MKSINSRSCSILCDSGRYTISTIAFYVLGASVLHGQAEVPAGYQIQFLVKESRLDLTYI